MQTGNGDGLFRPVPQKGNNTAVASCRKPRLIPPPPSNVPHCKKDALPRRILSRIAADTAAVQQRAANPAETASIPCPCPNRSGHIPSTSPRTAAPHRQQPRSASPTNRRVVNAEAPGALRDDDNHNASPPIKKNSANIESPVGLTDTDRNAVRRNAPRAAAETSPTSLFGRRASAPPDGMLVPVILRDFRHIDTASLFIVTLLVVPFVHTFRPNRRRPDSPLQWP